jgi:transcriptional antiterminator RfaH
MVVNTHPHREHFALENLQRQTYEAYCPVVRKRRSHARRVDIVLRPLFPNYLFVRTGCEGFTRGHPINSTYGVRRVVCVGEAPGCIEHAFVESLKAREIDGAIVRPVSPYEVGQQVRVAAGPFDRIVGTIIAMDEKDRLTVLVEIMNRSTRLILSSNMVAAA